MNDTDRFWSHVERTADCWEWTGCRVKGYGQFLFNGRRQYAHRVAFSLANGSIPTGMMVCHDCDNPGCVRPDHLYAGTAKTNSDDMYARGRAHSLLGLGRPDVTRRHAAALHASGAETATERSDDERWSRALRDLDTDAWLGEFSERLARGGRLPELVA